MTSHTICIRSSMPAKERAHINQIFVCPNTSMLYLLSTENKHYTPEADRIFQAQFENVNTVMIYMNKLTKCHECRRYRLYFLYFFFWIIIAFEKGWVQSKTKCLNSFVCDISTFFAKHFYLPIIWTKIAILKNNHSFKKCPHETRAFFKIKP